MMKYYGTLGPACADSATLQKMFEMGMTGLRLNTSHSKLCDGMAWLKMAEEAARAAGKKMELLIDLQGPEMRTGKLIRPMNLIAGEEIILTTSGSESVKVPAQGNHSEKSIHVPELLIRESHQGEYILMDDSKLKLQITCIGDGLMKAKVITGGSLTSAKSIQLQNRELKTPTLTEMDMENIRFAGAGDGLGCTGLGLTAVMQPFVRNRQDILNLRKALDDHGCKHVKIFAKIENLSGVRALDDILPFCDMIVIARGDLGTAVGLTHLPVVQKEIEARCHRERKPYMVVTQMLDSMTHAPVPTRAEVSDIAHAVWCRADALMLTGETAAGEYPAEAMCVLIETAQQAIGYRGYIGI